MIETTRDTVHDTCHRSEDVPGAYYSSDYTNTQMQAWNLTKTHIILQKHAAGRLAADECRFRKSNKEVRVNQLFFFLILKSKPMRFGVCTWQIMANQFSMTAMATGQGHNYQLMDFTQRRISNFEVAHDQVQWGSETQITGVRGTQGDSM